MNFSFKSLFLLCTILFNLKVAHAQDRAFSGNSIKAGLGIGASSANEINGLGLVYNFGYQRELWNGRFRINPRLSIGHYSSRFILDARDQYFNSVALQAILYYDLIKFNTFSLLVGAGGVVNHISGISGTGGDPEYYSKPPTSEFISQYHYGGHLSMGFRIDPEHKRTAITVLPVSVQLGNNGLEEVHLMVELEFKLR